MGVFLFAAAVLAAPSPSEEEIAGMVASGRCDRALAALDGLAESPGTERRPALEKLRARCLFELGDYPSCEQQLRELLEGPAGPGTEDHVECLAHLARALTFQDLHEEAMAVLEKALRLGDAPALHRMAITVLLRGGRFAGVKLHAEALLAADPSDPFAHFVRGIALSKEGVLDEAVPELSWGLRIPEAKRDAHFELALARGKRDGPDRALEHLLEILADDPYDEEACYQAAQQLARLRTPAAAETAACLRRYFLAFRKVQGESSREHPVEAIGHAALAAVMRAEKWRRLSEYGRALSEIRRAEAVARGDPESFLYEADFWAGLGLLAEADSALSRLEKRPGAGSDDVSERVEKLREALTAGFEALRAQAGSALGKARLGVATSSWEEARPALEALLGEAVAAGELSVADRAARVLLARDPRSVRALAFLAGRASGPSLLVPRLHYLTRLAGLLPGDEGYRGKLAEARRELLGKAP